MLDQPIANDVAELEWDHTCLQAEADICYEAFQRILKAETLDTAKQMVREARRAIEDGRTKMPE